MRTGRQGKATALLLGCALAALVSVGVEALFRTANRRRERGAETLYEPSGGPVEFRADLGYRPRPDSLHRMTKRLEGEVVYDMTYAFDAHSRRVVPVAGQDERERFIALFGGSFAFGEGVNDDETLAYHLAVRAPAHSVYNFGYSGYGPQHALVQLSDPGVAEEIPQRPGIGLYLFIPSHVRRAVGSMRVVTTWGRHFPCFELDDDGALVHLGSFKNARPGRTPLYGLVSREQILRFFEADVPLRVTEAHLELTARILSKARDAFVERFGPESRFYILLYPAHPSDEFGARRILGALEREDLDVLSLLEVLDLEDEGLLIPHDLHPAPEAHARVAAAIVERLALGGAEAPAERAGP